MKVFWMICTGDVCEEGVALITVDDLREALCKPECSEEDEGSAPSQEKRQR